MKKLLSFLLIFQMLLINSAFSQDEEEGGGDDLLKNTQNDVLVVAGAGAAGAILGLSTLSFVGQPSKHLSNIWTGAAIGIIAGVIYVAYNSAQRGQETMEEDEEASIHFKTSERLAWHETHQNLTVPEVQFGTQFWQMSF